MKKTISVALAVTALCVLSIATLWKIVQYTQAATAEKIRLELVRKAFMQQLQTQSGGYDFQPTLEAEDGIYFWVPDERSVYRLQSEILTPEYVCGDCDGYVQIVDETLQFLRDTGKTGQWICADLDGSNQQILKTGISTRNVNYIVLGQFLLDNRGSMHDNARRTSVQVARLSADRAEQTDLAKFCLGEQPAFRLLWTNGDVLFFPVTAMMPTKTYLSVLSGATILWMRRNRLNSHPVTATEAAMEMNFFSRTTAQIHIYSLCRMRNGLQP